MFWKLFPFATFARLNDRLIWHRNIHKYSIWRSWLFQDIWHTPLLVNFSMDKFHSLTVQTMSFRLYRLNRHLHCPTKVYSICCLVMISDQGQGRSGGAMVGTSWKSRPAKRSAERPWGCHVNIISWCNWQFLSSHWWVTVDTAGGGKPQFYSCFQFRCFSLCVGKYSIKNGPFL